MILAQARDSVVESACIADPNANYLVRPADHDRLADMLAGLVSGLRRPRDG